MNKQANIDRLNKQFDLMHKHYARMMWLYGDVKRQRPCVQRIRAAMRANTQLGFE